MIITSQKSNQLVMQYRLLLIHREWSRFRLSNRRWIRLSKLDLEIYKILHKDIDDDCEKAKLYSDSLSNCLESLRPNVTTAKDFDVVEQDDPTETLESMVMDTVPKTWKSHASSLLNHLQSIPNVSWSERGELILKQRLIP